MTETDSEKAEVLNEFFSSVFTLEPDDDDGVQVNCTTDLPRLTDVTVTEERMKKALRNLNPNKSPGPDEMHPRILKELASELSFPLTFLFEMSLNRGTIPTDWKEAEVRLIFKKGDKSDPGNYRPVSLTSVVCKIFESFIRDSLYSHLTDNKLLCKDQFGFVKGRSCTTQLLSTLYDWMTSLNDNT